MDDDEEVVKDVEDDEVDNIWMKCLLTRQTTMKKNMTIDMIKMVFL